MPVLSPHRSSSSGLSGTYRSNFGSTLDRPSYYGTSNYNPRITSYSERYSTRTYTDADGRRIFSRSGSITEDGVTTRFREESRDGSLLRESISRDRDSSDLEYRPRESSLPRGERLSTSGVIESVAELRNKYSPANYVPAIYRNKNDNNIARSKSINDIGLPPIEKSATSKKKQVNGASSAICVPVHNNNTNNRVQFANTNNSSAAKNNLATSVANHSSANFVNNSTKFDDLADNSAKFEDDNGNSQRASVAELRRKFDETPHRTVLPSKDVAGKFNLTEKSVSVKVTKAAEKNASPSSSALNSTSASLSNGFTHDSSESDSSSSSASYSNESKIDANGVIEEEQPRRSRVNQYSSYIPSKNGANGDISSDNESKSDSINNEFTTSSGATKSLNRTVTPSLGSTRRANVTSLQSDGDESDQSNTLTSDALARPRRGSTETRPLGLVGLRNIGNTCFMNSVIQCLSNTKPLLEYIRKEAYLKDMNTTASSMKGALIKSFAEVIRELWSGEVCERAVNTASLKAQIQRFAPRFMGYAQQDAQEFLRYLLEGLHEDVNRVTSKPKPITTDIDDSLSDKEKATEAWRRYLRMENSFVLDVFVGQLKSTLKCTHCGHCSVTFDPFWDLSLPLPPRSAGSTVRLTHCLDAFTKEETLDGDEKPTCAKCKERRKCTKSFAIQKFPQILVIHLKRFSPMERFRGKLNTQVEFPLDGLDLSSFAAEAYQSLPRYNLYAVSNHSGTPYSGHYTAHCRHPYDRTWHEYNDSHVGSASPRSVVSPEAYVLFYEQDGTSTQQKSHL